MTGAACGLGSGAAAHSHPDVLRQYADRIFARFPELFVFLGNPSLEQQFDLSKGSKANIIERPSGVVLQLDMAWEASHNKAFQEGAKDDRDRSLSPFSRSRRLKAAAAAAAAASGHRRSGARTEPATRPGHAEGAGTPRGERPGSSEEVMWLKAAGLGSRHGKASSEGEGYAAAHRVAHHRRQPGTQQKRSSVPTPPTSDSRRSAAGVQQTMPSLSAPTIAVQQLARAPPVPAWEHLQEEDDDSLPVLLSAASLMRLSPARRRSTFMDDPGKPVLSAPGTYDPWGDVEMPSLEGIVHFEA